MDRSEPHNREYLERLNLMTVLAGTEAGITFLRWLTRITGFNKSIMSLEDAARRDVWLTIRQYVPVEKLSDIEHFELREQQEMVHAMMETISQLEESND